MSEFADPDGWRKFCAYLSNSNRFVLSSYWMSFSKFVLETAEKRLVPIPAGQPFVRGRIGTTWVEFDNGDGQPSPLSPEEMGAPPKHKSKPGRINPEGMPCLYLSTNEKTAISEIRPWMGSDISIGYFHILEPLRVVDTSGDKPKSRFSRIMITKKNGEMSIEERPHESFTTEEIEAHIWGDINRDFSTPKSPNGPSLQYLGTQYLSELFKAEGYDGVAYQSSLSDDGYNLAIFNPEKAECSSCRMFEIESINYNHTESGNPVYLSENGKSRYTRLKIVGPVDAQSATDVKNEENGT